MASEPRLRVVFMGSAPIAVPTLCFLAETHDLVAVVTQPDKPAGRKRVLTPTAVKAEALARGLPVLEPRRLKDPVFVEALASAAPQVIVVMAYGRLVPPVVLSMPPLGCINLHGSILPRHRGPCPIERGILCGDATTGITTFYMDQGFDTGDLILQEEIAIEPEDSGGSLRERLSHVAVRVIGRTLDLVARGEAPRVPQDLGAGCHAPILGRSDARVEWSTPAAHLDRLVRACDPEPGAWCVFRGQPLKIRRLALPPGDVPWPGGTEAGTVIADGRGLTAPAGPVISAGTGEAVILREVQPAGKRWMSGAEFAAGYRLRVGQHLESVEEDPANVPS